MNIDNQNEVVNFKIQFFIDYWKDFTYQNSIEEELSHTILYNPIELFREFAYEIKLKELKNKDNKELFIQSINTFSKFPIQSIYFLKPTLTLITQQFQSPNFKYLLNLLRNIDKLLSNHQLGLNCIDEINNIVTSNEKLDEKLKEKIKILTRLIIFELIHKNYSITYIQKMIENIFDQYHIMPDNRISTNFPHDIQQPNNDYQSSEYIQYKHELKSFMDSLTLKQRLLVLKKYLNQKPKKITYIFQIQGLKSDLDFTFGNVRIYNPQNIKLIKNFIDDSIDELFGNTQNIYCNGAVTLDIIDYEYAKQEAVSILSTVIDIVVAGYSQYKIPVRINTENKCIIEENGIAWDNSSYGNGHPYIDYMHSIEINKSQDVEFYLNFYKNRFLNNQNNVDQKIIESLHWKRKAIESVNNNEKILWYWISIETLIKDTKLIFDIIPKFLAVKQLYQFAWKHFDKLRLLVSFGKYGHFRKKVSLSDEIKQNIGLNNTEIYLKDFFDYIPNIQNILNKNELFCQQLSDLKNILEDKEECIKRLKLFESISREKIIYIYRIRNKIVHDGYNHNNTLANYYLSFISQVSTLIVNEFMAKRLDHNLELLDDIINDILYDFDKLQLQIKNNGTEILFNKS